MGFWDWFWDRPKPKAAPKAQGRGRTRGAGHRPVPARQAATRTTWGSRLTPSQAQPDRPTSSRGTRNYPASQGSRVRQYDTPARAEMRRRNDSSFTIPRPNFLFPVAPVKGRAHRPPAGLPTTQSGPAKTPSQKRGKKAA